MFCFTAQGRIGRLERIKGLAEIIRLSIAADRRVEGATGQWTKTEWLSVVCFDRALNERLLTELEVGHSVSIDGRIEPCKRPVGDKSITDHSFVLTSFALLSKPKPSAKSKAVA
jgi:single-stranded DNA-binding protein